MDLRALLRRHIPCWHLPNTVQRFLSLPFPIPAGDSNASGRRWASGFVSERRVPKGKQGVAFSFHDSIAQRFISRSTEKEGAYDIAASSIK